MTKKYAVIDPETNLVENVILADEIFQIPGKLLVASENAGIGWIFSNGEFSEPEEISEPVYKTIEEAKSSLYDLLNNFTFSVTGEYPKDEQASWVVKESAARKFLAGTADLTEVNLLQTEANLTGETLIELSELIVSISNNYRMIIANVTGIRRVAERQFAAVIDANDYWNIIEEARQKLAQIGAQ